MSRGRLHDSESRPTFESQAADHSEMPALEMVLLVNPEQPSHSNLSFKEPFEGCIFGSFRMPSCRAQLFLQQF